MKRYIWVIRHALICSLNCTFFLFFSFKVVQMIRFAVKLLMHFNLWWKQCCKHPRGYKQAFIANSKFQLIFNLKVQTFYEDLKARILDGSHNDTEFYNEFCQETRMFLDVKYLFYFSKATSLNTINFNSCFLFDSSLLRSNDTCIYYNTLCKNAKI